MDECRKIKPDFIKNGNPVESYVSHGKGDGVTVTLGDGTTADADMLVGSDGIWSAVRSQMYNEGGVKAGSADRLMRQGCRYSGYTVFAGETVVKTSKSHSNSNCAVMSCWYTENVRIHSRLSGKRLIPFLFL
jgi:zeaxanthin epoxidase